LLVVTLLIIPRPRRHHPAIDHDHTGHRDHHKRENDGNEQH